MASPDTHAIDPNERVVIVSCDTHIGPRLREDLRALLPEGRTSTTTTTSPRTSKRRTAAAAVDVLIATDGHFDPYRASKT